MEELLLRGMKGLLLRLIYGSEQLTESILNYPNSKQLVLKSSLIKPRISNGRNTYPKTESSQS